MTTKEIAISVTRATQKAPARQVHKVPTDLRKALASNSKVLVAWEDITPLARNEWIC